MSTYLRKPDWLKIKITGDASNFGVEHMLSELSLNTICREANCPNRMECYHKKTATFMILGKVCTRNCRFCNVVKGQSEQVDSNEPMNIAHAVKKLDLKHIVVTSVTRDDLPDGGAQHFADTITAIRSFNPGITIEVLIPDLKGDWESLHKIIVAKPDVINHNVETVPSLYNKVRPMAIYTRSVELLRQVKVADDGILTKSGMMVGLGETPAEVEQVMSDLRTVSCDILTIGQYLPPSLQHYPLVEYVHPKVFKFYEELGLKMGFSFIASAPLVRSSYQAGDVFEAKTSLYAAK
jgi:lipoic acid synthetase